MNGTRPLGEKSYSSDHDEGEDQLHKLRRGCCGPGNDGVVDLPVIRRVAQHLRPSMKNHRLKGEFLQEDLQESHATIRRFQKGHCEV